MTDNSVLVRSLKSQDIGGARIIEALRWPTPFGSGLRVYLGAPDQPHIGPETVKGALGLDLAPAQRIGPNHILSGTGPDGQGAIAVSAFGQTHQIETAAPETALFDSLDVLLAERGGESPAQIAQWLALHVQTHRVNALLLIDRAPETDGFSAALAAQPGLPVLDRLVVVFASFPLGQPDLPAAFDRAFAPRAKSRQAKVDRWRAPLGEPALYDALRWRFLARAGAVITLSPSDVLLPPDDGSNAFDAVRQSHTGVVPILGEAIYPWRIRKGLAPTWHDHICRADPAVAAPKRWGAAPKRLGADALWAPGGIAGAPVLADDSLSYQRAMALAFPEADAAELVNKDVLVLDAPRLEAAQAAGAKPVQPPAQPKAGPRTMIAPPSGRTCVVTCMKNEGPFLLEWIAYHKMIGVDDFLVYTNDCEDGTDTFLDLLAARGLVQRRDNPFRKTKGKPQQSALDAAGSEPLVRQAGWLLSMDVDEFINVHVGGNRLPDLYAAVGDASLISMTWRLFGNNDVAGYQDKPVTDQFTRCAPQVIRRPHQAWGFKTLFRNQGLFKGMGVHRPRGFLGDAQDSKATWVNGSGKAMPERLFKTGWRSDVSTFGYDLVTLNHYAVRSAESFLVKRDRGRVNHVSRDQGEAYWFRMNNNDEQDLSIQVHAKGLHDAIAALKADPEIARAHDEAVAWHRGKIAALQSEPDYAALFDTLTSDRMRRLSRMLRHFGMNVFLAGPSVIPDKVFSPDLPENFLFNVAPPQGPAAE